MLTITNEQLAESSPLTVRRYSTRYEPTHRDACLSWHEPSPDLVEPVDGDAEGWGLPVIAPESQFALLLDISLTGASVALDRLPPVEADVWIRLGGDCVTDWTEAQVVGVTTTARGPHLVRLSFRSPCPFETLRAAVCG